MEALLCNRSDAATVQKCYGPRIIVRSITCVSESEEVCITYTDLLQAKGTRKLELWKKYRFDCVCERCSETPMSYADEVLQKIGICNSPAEISALEECLLNDAEQGIVEFMGRNNPWSCCQILEHALERLAHGAYQDLTSQDGLQMSSYECSICNRSRNVFVGAADHSSTEIINVGSQVQQRVQNGNRFTVHMMHRMCLDIYTALSSSYRVAAVESHHLAKEKLISPIHRSLDGESAEQKDPSGICESAVGVIFRAASAGYTLLMASAVQHLFESGEHGLIALAARLWLHTGEAFIGLISGLDSRFCLGSSKSVSRLHSESRRRGDSTQVLGYTLEETYSSELRVASEILHARGNIMDFNQPTLDFGKSLAHTLECVWPLLSESSPFLSYIENPLDPNKIHYRKSIVMEGKLNSAEIWKQSRISFLFFSRRCLQYSKYLSEVCCGYADPLVTAAQNSLLWVM